MAPKVPLFLLVTSIALAGAAFAPGYVGGATFVVRDQGNGTLADAGAVVCKSNTGSGIGGACIPWAGLPAFADSLLVTDEASVHKVAFQVCIDENGDGQCGYHPAPCGGVQDKLFFSHGDGNAWFNPIGPLKTSHQVPGCGGFQGWILILCEGAHNDSGSGPHAHPASVGTASPTVGGTGFGNFCGPQNGELDPSFPPKPYIIV